MQKPLINNQIRANEVRVIDESGNQLGIIPLIEAINNAKAKGLDLIQVTEKVEPPVCRIMEYGKFLYQLGKKNKASKNTQGELKGIRLRFGISPHDLEVRALQTESFFKKGHKVKVELILRGREKALPNVAKEKIEQFLKILEQKTPVQVEREIKREPRGFTMIIGKGIVKPSVIKNEKETENQKINNQAL